MDSQRLVRDCLKGKPAAQKELCDMFSESMMGICYRYTKSVTDAEDILQEGFVKVFNYLHTFRFDGELGGWIRRIMVTTAINFLKRNERYQHELAFSDTVLHPISHDDPGIKLETKELLNMIRQLPPGYQAIFNLHAVEGYSHVEIGKIMGISEGTSRSQYARARNLLISWLRNKSVNDIKTERYARK